MLLAKQSIQAVSGTQLRWKAWPGQKKQQMIVVRIQPSNIPHKNAITPGDLSDTWLLSWRRHMEHVPVRVRTPQCIPTSSRVGGRGWNGVGGASWNNNTHNLYIVHSLHVACTSAHVRLSAHVCAAITNSRHTYLVRAFATQCRAKGRGSGGPQIPVHLLQQTVRNSSEHEQKYINLALCRPTWAVDTCNDALRQVYDVH